MFRYDEAANAFSSYINLLPNKERSQKAAWARAQVQFLESFKGVTPVDIDAEDRAALHTLPFRLVNDKVVVRARINGSTAQDFILDTGSEETIISDTTARRQGVRPVTETISAGVGEIGIRGLQLARLKSLDLGTLQVRNVPVLVKSPGLRGMPKPEGESFSPLAIGMSMIDRLREAAADHRQPLAGHGSRLPAADAHAPPGDGARPAQRHPSRLFRRRHRRGSDFDQRRHRPGAAAVAVSADSAARCGAPPAGIATRSCCRASIWTSTGSRIRNVSLVVLNLRVAQPAARIPARRHRRPQVPGALSRLHGSDAERTAAAEILNSQLGVGSSVKLRAFRSVL